MHVCSSILPKFFLRLLAMVWLVFSSLPFITLFSTHVILFASLTWFTCSDAQVLPSDLLRIVKWMIIISFISYLTTDELHIYEFILILKRKESWSNSIHFSLMLRKSCRRDKLEREKQELGINPQLFFNVEQM